MPRTSATLAVLNAIELAYVDHLQPFNDRKRDQIPLLQVTTMSGMGKSVFGYCTVSHIRELLLNTKVPLADPKRRTELQQLFRNARYLYVDFNGTGDALDSDDMVDLIGSSKRATSKNFLAVRMAARGLLNAETGVARHQSSLFRSTESVWSAATVLDEMFVRHRLQQRIPDSEPAMIFVHVDEFQLCIQDLHVQNNFSSKAEAVMLLIRAFEEVVLYNMTSSSLNLVIVLTTGTSQSGILLQPTQFRTLPIAMQPLDFESSQRLLKEIVPLSTHESWFTAPKAQRLLSDMGGVAHLIQDFLYFPLTQPFDAHSRTQELAIATAVSRNVARYQPAELFYWLGMAGVFKLVRLCLARVPVALDTSIGNTTVDQLALLGVVVTTPVTMLTVMLDVPIPLLSELVSFCVTTRNPSTANPKSENWVEFVHDLVAFPMASDGIAFEAATAFSLSSRLTGLGSRSRKETPNVSLRDVIKVPDTLTEGYAGTTAEQMLASHILLEPVEYGVFRERDQFYTRTKGGSIPKSCFKVAAVPLLTQSMTADMVTFNLETGVPDGVLLTADESPAGDLRLVFRRETGKWLMVIIQCKDLQLHLKAAKTAAEPGRGLLAALDSSALADYYDFLFVLCITGSHSQETNPKERAQANRKWSEAVCKADPQERMLVLFKDELRGLAPYFFHRI